MDKLTPTIEAAILRMVADAFENQKPYTSVSFALREEAARREAYEKYVEAEEIALPEYEKLQRESKTTELGQTQPAETGDARGLSSARTAPSAGRSDPNGEREGLGSAANTLNSALDVLAQGSAATFEVCGQCITPGFCKTQSACQYPIAATFAPCPECQTPDHCSDDGACGVAFLRVANHLPDAGKMVKAPFRLEVGKEYARRDGTGPVPIVSKGGGFFNDAEGAVYYENGHFTALCPTPRDLVSLWQAEAQAPQTDADDLVQRLRAIGPTRSLAGTACQEAADRIEAQAREIDALKARMSELESATVSRERIIASLERRLDGPKGYRARVARLTVKERKVIEAAENWKDAPPHTSLSVCHDLIAAVEALQSKKVRK